MRSSWSGAESDVADSNISHFLSKAARTIPSADCLAEASGRTWTYSQIDQLADCAAHGLKATGLRAGDRIGLCMPNHPAYLVFLYAAWRAELVVVGMNPLYPLEGLREQITKTSPRLVITLDDESLLAKTMAMCRNAGTPVFAARRDAGDLLEPPADLAAALGRLQAAPTESSTHDATRLRLASLNFTGGSTGEPKAAMLTHANFVGSAEIMAEFYGRLTYGAEAFLAAAPFTHIGGLQNTINLPFALGGKIVLVERFKPDDVLDLIRRAGITAMTVVPTMLVGFLKSSLFASVDWSQVKYVTCGGAPLPRDLTDTFLRRTGIAVLNGYGLTECTGTAAIMPPERALSGHATGAPLPRTRIEVRDISDASQSLPCATAGEVCIEGPSVMAGYWARPDETAASFEGAFFRTGDLGFLDSDGLLHLVDRLKDVIIAGGFNVYPVTVENAIRQHAAVGEVAVIGAPDAYRGETVVAFVALNEGLTLTASALTAFLTEKLSPIEMPKRIRFIDTLPRTAAGKVAKATLRALESDAMSIDGAA